VDLDSGNTSSWDCKKSQLKKMMTPMQHAHEHIPGNPSTTKGSHYRLNDRSNGRALQILSEEDWSHWQREGYVVVKAAVSPEQAKRTAEFLWEFEEKDPSDSRTWYTPPRAEMKMKELANTGMVECYNHQLFWENRQEPRIYRAFCDIWGIDALWVTIDRANLNFPIRPGHDYQAFIHWDYDPETKPVNVQGVLALADQTDEAMGGFQCIPDLYRNYDQWKRSQPVDRNQFMPDTTGFTPTKVKLEAGDLLIFNSLLPHGIRANLTRDKVRIAQYIAMMPAESDNEPLRQWRIRSWQDRVAPEGHAFPGDPRRLEQTRYHTATLSPLGRKLLGIDPWPE